MIMMYVGLIGKIFSKAGLRDLTLQIDVLVTGSVNKVSQVRCTIVQFVSMNLRMKGGTDFY